MLDMIDTPLSPQMDETYKQKSQEVHERYESLDEQQRAKRAREVAKILGISEAQWVASACGPVRSVKLEGNGQEIFRKLGSLGRVMALTRNDICVHERHGAYEDIKGTGHVGLVLGPDIDLRVFFSCWDSAWAVEEGGRHSLQFFDTEGVAIHKVYCTDETDTAQYLKLVQEHAVASVWPAFQAIEPDVRQDRVDDAQAFRDAWLNLKDTHDFFPMLRKFNVNRQGALLDVGADLAQQVPVDTIDKMLRNAAAEGQSIMCFVGNRGMIQIHTGPVERIVERGPWLNVLDPTFNLHLDVSRVSQVWVVNKPTVDGWVTSLEVYDAQGELIVQFFGARKPGKPELVEWRHLMTSFCKEALAS
ncbi:hemin-degrading factor [Orrella marina]|nr:ChuX/HutX family heme-like substrate-binding protein [Orrella marina]